MPISPELSRLPKITASFYQSGLLGELLLGMAKGEMGRDLVTDARILMKELDKDKEVSLRGLENIPADSGCMIVFNHPNMEVLLPAILDLTIKIDDRSKQKVKIAMGSEIPMTTSNFNDKTALPGSIWLLNRFHGMYSNNIISVPTVEGRSDFLTGRATAVRKMLRSFQERDIVIISPEGHVEENNVLSPLETYHSGSGKLAMLSTKMGVPTVPVSIWESGIKRIEVVIGQPFMVTATEPELAVIEAMFEVSKNLPEELRGPFR